MKKIIIVILAVSLAVSMTLILTGCNSNSIKQFLSGKEPSSIADIAAGGWSKVSSPVITDELKAVFDKAAGELTGMSYEPVAYLETQVVAGRNHLFLCVGTATVPGAKPYYSLVTIYEKLDGSAEITSMTDSVIPAVVAEEIDGGWAVPETCEVTKEAKNALEKASEMLTGAEYMPVALLGTQIVSGTNYALLCEMKATVPDAAGQYVIVKVYEDLKGNASITDSVSFYDKEAMPTQAAEEQTETTNAP